MTQRPLEKRLYEGWGWFQQIIITRAATVHQFLYISRNLVGGETELLEQIPIGRDL